MIMKKMRKRKVTMRRMKMTQKRTGNRTLKPLRRKRSSTSPSSWMVISRRVRTMRLRRTRLSRRRSWKSTWPDSGRVARSAKVREKEKEKGNVVADREDLPRKAEEEEREENRKLTTTSESLTRSRTKALAGIYRKLEAIRLPAD